MADVEGISRDGDPERRDEREASDESGTGYRHADGDWFVDRPDVYNDAVRHKRAALYSVTFVRN